MTCDEHKPGLRVRNYTIHFPAPPSEVFNVAEQRVLEIYRRTVGKVEGIKYGKNYVKEKWTFKDLELCLRQPMEFKPDLRIEAENVRDLKA
jgi:hypothetical protein